MFKLFTIFIFFCFYREEVLSNFATPKLPDKVVYKLEDVDKLFQEFSTKYNKSYDPVETVHRRKIFGDNLMKINLWNIEYPDGVFGIGPFTDMTFEEFTRTHTGALGNITDDNAEKYVPKGMAPETLDWRQKNIVTRVKNQNACGSCYVFAAIGNIESQYAKKHGELIELSEQQGLDCNPRGCGGGFSHEVMQSLASQGCMRESDYPYETAKSQCRTDASKVVVRVIEGRKLAISSEEELKDAVANIGPMAVAMYTNQELVSYRGGIFNPRSACNGDGHAVLIVGYGTENGVPYWLIKNSWGDQWNENGYLRMIRGRGACDVGMSVASATVE